MVFPSKGRNEIRDTRDEMEECDAGCEIRDIPYDRLLGCSVIPGRERVSDVMVSAMRRSACCS